MQIIHNDCRIALKQLEKESVDCIITSPPYFSLRKYAISDSLWGGDENCQHEFNSFIRKGVSGGTASEKVKIKGQENYQIVENTKQGFCLKCNAWQGQLGLEPTPDLYIEHLVSVFDLCKDVLKKEGTLWVVIGDSYNSQPPGNKTLESNIRNQQKAKGHATDCFNAQKNKNVVANIQSKSLLLIPFRFALAMQQKGYIIRNVLIWKKSNCIPQSMNDRFTVDFEYIFLFVKNKKYYFEQQFENWTDKNKHDIKRSIEGHNQYKGKWVKKPKDNYSLDESKVLGNALIGRNMRSVWQSPLMKLKNDLTQEQKLFAIKRLSEENVIISTIISHNIVVDYESVPDDTREYFEEVEKEIYSVWTVPTQPLKQKHYASYPKKLVERMIRAGCPEFVCSKCGKAKRKKIFYKGESTSEKIKQRGTTEKRDIDGIKQSLDYKGGHETNIRDIEKIEYETCNCNVPFIPGTVLDPFAGSGTTGIVARQLNRDFILIEVGQEYIDIIKERMEETKNN